MLAVVALTVATALAVADPASAHAILSGSNPAPGAVLAKAPATVTLHFSEAVTTVPESLRVLGPDGSRADAGTVRVTGDGSDIAVDLSRATKQGSYFVSWRVVSADSHPISGAFTFAIGATSAAPASANGRSRATAGQSSLWRSACHGGPATSAWSCCSAGPCSCPCAGRAAGRDAAPGAC